MARRFARRKMLSTAGDNKLRHSTEQLKVPVQKCAKRFGFVVWNLICLCEVVRVVPWGKLIQLVVTLEIFIIKSLDLSSDFRIFKV